MKKKKKVNAARKSALAAKSAELAEVLKGIKEGTIVSCNVCALFQDECRVAGDRADKAEKALDTLTRQQAQAHEELCCFRSNDDATAQAYREMLQALIEAGVPILIPSDSLPPHWYVGVEIIKKLAAQAREIEALKAGNIHPALQVTFEELVETRARVTRLTEERDNLKATNQSLNRRCQQAESRAWLNAPSTQSERVAVRDSHIDSLESELSTLRAHVTQQAQAYEAEIASLRSVYAQKGPTLNHMLATWDEIALDRMTPTLTAAAYLTCARGLREILWSATPPQAPTP